RIGLQRPAHCRRSHRDAVDRDRGGGDQPADEAAARLVVPAQHDEDREGEHHHRDHRRDGAEDQRVHDASARRRAPRISASTAMPAVITTEISPSVSSPRKSTRMTLTTLWPWASGTLFRLKKSLSRGSSVPLSTAKSSTV